MTHSPWCAIRLKFTPDGRRVLVTDLMAGELIVLDAAARTVEKRIPLEGRPLGLAVAADGKRAFGVDAAGNRLIAVDLRCGAVGCAAGPCSQALSSEPRTATRAIL